MTATQGLLIYSTKNRAVRRMVIPDLDAEIADPAVWLQPGESYAYLPRDVMANSRHDVLLAGHLGVAVEDLVPPRAAMLDPDGVVVQLLAADAELDQAPAAGHTLVNSQTAKIGDRYVDGAFTSPG